MSVQEHFEVRWMARRGKRRDARVISHQHYCMTLEDAQSFREVIAEDEDKTLVGNIKIVRVLEEEIAI
jgi:hypothetical protein